MPYNSELARPLTSIVSYPERGAGGNNRYRGNCSPKLIEDLIGFFKPKEICDYMCGSGTTKAAADKLGIKSQLYDLHSGFDIMNCDIKERPEFIFWHTRLGTLCPSDELRDDEAVLCSRKRWQNGSAYG